MIQQWSALEEKFNSLSQRERGLIATALLVLIGMCAYLPIESSVLEYTRAKSELKQIVQENGYSRQQVELYQQRLTIDPNQDIQKQLSLLAEQISAVDEQLNYQMVDMVPAKYMPRVLSGLLAKIKGIELKKFASIPPVPLLEVGEQEKMNLYSHGIKLVLVGDYFSVLRFIKAVEVMPDKLYWKSIDYRVTQHPLAEVEIELYTLSINEDFISVAQ